MKNEILLHFKFMNGLSPFLSDAIFDAFTLYFETNGYKFRVHLTDVFSKLVDKLESLCII